MGRKLVGGLIAELNFVPFAKLLNANWWEILVEHSDETMQSQGGKKKNTVQNVVNGAVNNSKKLTDTGYLGL